MNKKQKQVQQHLLNDEKLIAERLRKVYAQAQTNIDKKVQELLARQDANTPTVIYQVQHQQALRQQISGILDQLQGEQFTTIEGYLEGCYTNGYVGALYDITDQLGGAVPFVMAPDPRQVVRAVQLKSKISTDLYTALGQDVEDMKRKISATISRGIATGMGYGPMAKLLNKHTQVGMNNTLRIVRTEGHRIQIQSGLDACQAAKDSGCDVVKQWDATMDGRTRPHHRQLDGQIREIEEDFELPTGGKASAPGMFGKPAEDINCRCALLQRAKWALDEDELETLKERAEFFGLDKSQEFEDFKKKYLKAAEEEKAAEKPYNKDEEPATGEESSPYRVKVDMDDMPAYFRDSPTRKKQTQAWLDAINSVEGADPDVLLLYKRMASMESVASNGIPIKVSYTADGHAIAYRTWTRTGGYADVTVKIPKINGIGTVDTTSHELAHLIDLFQDDGSGWGSARSATLRKAFQTTSGDISDEMADLFRRYNAEGDAVNDRIMARYNAERAELVKDMYSLPYAEFKARRKQVDKLWKDAIAEIDAGKRDALGGGVGQLQDIYDALSGGTARGTKGALVRFGHGAKYYANYDNRLMETWANYCSLSVNHPELIEMLERDKPDLVAALRGLVAETVNQ